MTTSTTTPAQDPKPKCGAKHTKHDGTCKLPAGWGTEHLGWGPCKLHFGATPNAIKGAERERVTSQARKALEGIEDFTEVTDPVQRLRLLAGRCEAFMEAMGTKVADLTSLRYESKTAEQVRGEIQIYQQAMAAAGKILVDLARLGLDERAIRLEEQQVALLAGALGQALEESGLPAERQQAIRQRVGELVEVAGGGTTGGPRVIPGSVVAPRRR